MGLDAGRSRAGLLVHRRADSQVRNSRKLRELSLTIDSRPSRERRFGQATLREQPCDEGADRRHLDALVGTDHV